MNNSNFKLLEKYYNSLPTLPRGRHRIVAGIWEKSRLISLGYNQFKTHPKQVAAQRRHNPTREYLHAEIHALCQAANVRNWSPERSSIYVYRHTKDGLPALAAPCDGCREALRLMRIKKLFYTNLVESRAELLF